MDQVGAFWDGRGRRTTVLIGPTANRRHYLIRFVSADGDRIVAAMSSLQSARDEGSLQVLRHCGLLGSELQIRGGPVSRRQARSLLTEPTTWAWRASDLAASAGP